MMSRVFSLAVLAACIYLAYQQFPSEARVAAEWATDRIVAVADQLSSGDSERIGSSATGVPAGADVSEIVPPPADVDALGEFVVTEAESEDPDPLASTTDRPLIVEATPSSQSDTFLRGQTLATDPAPTDFTRPLHRPAAHDRRDALAALAERMETIAIERAR